MAELSQRKSAAPEEEDQNHLIYPVENHQLAGSSDNRGCVATRTTPANEKIPSRVSPPPVDKHIVPDQLVAQEDVYSTIQDSSLDSTVNTSSVPSQNMTNARVNEIEFPESYTLAERSQFVEKCATQRNRRGISKNIVVLCIAFVLTFSAFLNMETWRGILTHSLTLHNVSFILSYATTIISCILLTPFVIQKLGCKKTMALALVPYALFMAAHFYVSWSTLIPAALLVGIGSSLLWPSAFAYLSESAVMLAEHSGTEHSSTITAVTGLFYMVVFSCYVWGNLITAFILQNKSAEAANIPAPPPELLSRCGTSGCGLIYDSPNSTRTITVDIVQVYTLCGTYVCMCVLAILTIVCLLSRLETSPTFKPWQHSRSDLTDPGLPRPVLKQTTSQLDRRQHCCTVVSQTLKQWRNKKQLLLIPMTLYCGLEQAFFMNVFSKVFVNCVAGPGMVSYVVISCGAVAAFMSPVFGWLARFKGKIPLFIIGAVLHIGVIVALYLWKPHPGNVTIFYIVAMVWGAGEAVWLPQTAAVYGSVFPRTRVAGFSNLHLWQTVGTLLSSLSAFFFCVSVKLSLLLAMLVLSLGGYITVEMLERSKRRNYNVRERTLSCDDTGV